MSKYLLVFSIFFLISCRDMVLHQFSSDWEEPSVIDPIEKFLAGEKPIDDEDEDGENE